MGELLGMLSQRPTKTAGKTQSDDYDLTMRELVYEARAQATDRLQTPEEVARAEKAKLDTLEKARVLRMSNQVRHGKMPGALPVQSGRRKRKGRNDDELNPDGEEVTATETNEQYGEQSEESGDDLTSEGDSDEVKTAAADELEGEWMSDSDSGEEEEDTLAPMGSCAGKSEKELPYVVACPSSYEDLLALLAEHATTTDDINTILDRIHKNHSIKLDSRNKEKMHNFYDVLLKRFRRVGGQSLKLSSTERQDRESQLDFLSRLIYDITEEMPEVAASLWHRYVGGLHQRMLKALADLSVGTCASGYWPSTGSLLLLKLLVQIFPSTDFRHPVVTPVLLHLSQCLSQCPVKTGADLCAGIFSCSLLLHCCLGADRVSPEVMVFASSALAQFCPGRGAQATPSPAFRNSQLGWLRAAAGSYKGTNLPALSMGMSEGLTSSERQTFAAGFLADLYRLVLQTADTLQGNVAFPELFGPIQSVLSQVQPKAKPSLPRALENLHLKVSRQLAVTTEKCLSARSALQWRVIEPPALDALAPKFQESYKMKKDGHKDAEQTKLKQLQRQVKRERKGAMRELKRDAVFLEHAKAEKTEEKEKARQVISRTAAIMDLTMKRRLRENLTWLEGQQATINQQVKLGGELVKGGGSSLTKRARVGRGF
ncbi:unnamed protein product [Laminaria digitata]